MIDQNDIFNAFMNLAPKMMGGDVEKVCGDMNVDPNGIAGVGNHLTNMYAAQSVPPEEAVPASFSIGILVGLELGRLKPPSEQ